jgi:polyhydroxybutyrate depolymerase
VSSGAGASGASSGGTGGAGGGAPAPFTCAGKPGASGSHLISLTSSGVLRTSLLHVPPGYDPEQGAPLVLNFHGFGSDAPQEVLLTGMSEASDERGFLVAYPYGIVSSWNAGQCCGQAWVDAVDDVQFVADLIATIAEDYCVDPRRIHATGMSNGGFLSHRLGCELADRIAAIAPVAGVLGIDPAACKPGRAVPVMQFHGTEDMLVPYEGGVPLVQWDVEGVLNFLSVDETLAVWREINGCAASSEVIYQQGDSTCVRWLACDGGSEVVRCVAEGAGHTWPGGMPVPPLGETTEDMSATEMMLDFFEAHPMPW